MNRTHHRKRVQQPAAPTPRAVRIVGRLDAMCASQRSLKVEVHRGQVVTAFWKGRASITKLKTFFNRDVIVEGIGVFRRSGSLLRIDADAIVFANPRDEFFRRMPTAPVARDYRKLVQLRPGQKSVYAQLRGSVPAEESAEEFAAAVDELS